MPITQTRKNAILAAISAAGLEPAGFDWEQEPTEVNDIGPGNEAHTVDVLVHRPTGYRFKFDAQLPRGSLWALYTPGPEGAPRREHAGSWEYVWSYLTTWLATVKEEHDAPDLWSQLRQQRELMIGEGAENTAFTPEERARIASQLNEAKEYVRANFELDPAQLDQIESQLDYLIEASGRIGRVDWRNLLIGSFLALALQTVVPVAPIQQLLLLLFHGLESMFSGSGGPSLPGAPSVLA